MESSLAVRRADGASTPSAKTGEALVEYLAPA